MSDQAQALSLALMSGHEAKAIDILNAMPDDRSRIEALVTTDIQGISPLHRILSGDHFAVWQAVESFLTPDQVRPDLLGWQAALPAQETTNAFDRWLVRHSLEGDFEGFRRNNLFDRALLASDIERFKTLLEMGSPHEIDRMIHDIAVHMSQAAQSVRLARQQKNTQQDDDSVDANDENTIDFDQLDLDAFGIDYGPKWVALIEKTAPKHRPDYLDKIPGLFRQEDLPLLSWRDTDLARSLETIVDGLLDMGAAPEKDVFEKIYVLTNRFYETQTTKFQGLALLVRMRDWLDQYEKTIGLQPTKNLLCNAIQMGNVPNTKAIDHLALVLAWIYNRPERYKIAHAHEQFRDETLNTIKQAINAIYPDNTGFSEYANQFLKTFLYQDLPLMDGDEEELLESVRDQEKKRSISLKTVISLLERRIMKRSVEEMIDDSNSSSDRKPDRLIEQALSIGL